MFAEMKDGGKTAEKNEPPNPVSKRKWKRSLHMMRLYGRIAHQRCISNAGAYGSKVRAESTPLSRRSSS